MACRACGNGSSSGAAPRRRRPQTTVATGSALNSPPAPPPDLAQLTERETEVLVEVARGRSHTEIAHELFMSYATAKTHVSRLLTKLEARDRARLVVVAYESGLVQRGATEPRIPNW